MPLEDDKTYRPVNAQPMSIDDLYLLGFGISASEWRAIKRDVERGSRKFWAKRGLPEPDGAWKLYAAQRHVSMVNKEPEAEEKESLDAYSEYEKSYGK